MRAERNDKGSDPTHQGNSGTDTSDPKETQKRKSRKPLNDDYATQLNENLELGGGGRTTAQDTTFGRYYDDAIRKAKNSTNVDVREFAENLYDGAQRDFYRIHADNPVPVI